MVARRPVLAASAAPDCATLSSSWSHSLLVSLLAAQRLLCRLLEQLAP
jgi:hypothetical protein